jgi:hypothetical protein
MRKIHAEYSWDKWFNKTHFTLVQGTDFTCAIHGMASQIRTKASKRKLRVSLIIHGRTIVTTMKGKI